jgi:hypothetical protein
VPDLHRIIPCGGAAHRPPMCPIFPEG